MRTLAKLFEQNRAWAQRIKGQDPEFFLKLRGQQSPQYLWIGCSDSRVPANQIVDLMPGEVFVHRNVANVVSPADNNCLSVVKYAIEVLKVPHIILCGHYGCGGVQAVLNNSPADLVENWLSPVKSAALKHSALLDRQTEHAQRFSKLCELNVIEQALNLSRTGILQAAWQRGQTLSLHGWIYDVSDGLLHDLGVCITQAAEIEPMYRAAVMALSC